MYVCTYVGMYLRTVCTKLACATEDPVRLRAVCKNHHVRSEVRHALHHNYILHSSRDTVSIKFVLSVVDILVLPSKHSLSTSASAPE